MKKINTQLNISNNTFNWLKQNCSHDLDFLIKYLPNKLTRDYLKEEYAHPENTKFIVVAIDNDIVAIDDGTAGFVVKKDGLIPVDDIKVGDKVRVIDAGKQYSGYIDWFKSNNLFELGLRFSYGVLLTSLDMKKSFKVVAIHPYSKQTPDMIYAVEETDSYHDRVFLIDKTGLEKVD